MGMKGKPKAPRSRAVKSIFRFFEDRADRALSEVARGYGRMPVFMPQPPHLIELLESMPNIVVANLDDDKPVAGPWKHSRPRVYTAPHAAELARFADWIVADGSSDGEQIHARALTLASDKGQMRPSTELIFQLLRREREDVLLPEEFQDRITEI
jgi:hypothetical protein